MIFRFFIILIFSLSFASSSANAQDADAIERAKAHFQSGKMLTEKGKFEEALKEFETGYRLSNKPLFLFNMGECARQAGKTELAREYYSEYLVHDAGGSMSRLATKRLKALPKAKKKKKVVPILPKPGELVSLESEHATQVVHVHPATQSQPVDDKTIFEDWPFWVAVGAVLIIGGTTTAVVLTQMDKDDPGGCNGSPMCASF